MQKSLAAERGRWNHPDSVMPSMCPLVRSQCSNNCIEQFDRAARAPDVILAESCAQGHGRCDTGGGFIGRYDCLGRQQWKINIGATIEFPITGVADPRQQTWHDSRYVDAQADQRAQLALVKMPQSDLNA